MLTDQEQPGPAVDGHGRAGVHHAAVLETQAVAPFDLVTVRASQRATREPYVYEHIRDELTANLEAWIREGGALPEDTKLAEELHVWEWRKQVNGRLKLWPKKQDLRKSKGTPTNPAIGRSPDRYDAVTLSVWVPLEYRTADGKDPTKPARDDDDDDFAESTFDPYASGDWRK